MHFGEGKTKDSRQIKTINTLQKLMFARPCNNRLFLESEEIKYVLKGSTGND